MTILVSGGASCGKSEFAERLIVEAGGNRRIYFATMEVWDDEGRAKAEKHRRMRAGKGFETLERPRDLTADDLPDGCDVLLECLANLTANECFGGLGADGCAERIAKSVRELSKKARLLVVVTNEVFSDGIDYPQETASYMRELGRANRLVADFADQVIEVVCGIPVFHKGGNP